MVVNAPVSLDRKGTETAPALIEAEGALANVLVEIPASYYEDRHREFFGEGRPDRAVLERLVAFTREQIQVIVHHVIPDDRLGQLQVLMLPLAPGRGATASAVPAARRSAPSWWVPAAIVAAGASLALLTAAGGWVSNRRASLRTSPGTRSPPRTGTLPRRRRARPRRPRPRAGPQ